jgi:hypothetical protein
MGSQTIGGAIPAPGADTRTSASLAKRKDAGRPKKGDKRAVAVADAEPEEPEAAI